MIVNVEIGVGRREGGDRVVSVVLTQHRRKCLDSASLDTTYRIARRDDRIRQTDVVQQLSSSGEVGSVVVAVVLEIDLSARAEL